MEYLNYEEELDGSESVIEEIDIPEIEEVVEPVVEEAPAVSVIPTTELKIDNKNGIVLYSQRDMKSKDGLSISAGYSKINELDAKKWLNNKSVRVASAEEIKTYFNK